MLRVCTLSVAVRGLGSARSWLPFAVVGSDARLVFAFSLLLLLDRVVGEPSVHSSSPDATGASDAEDASTLSGLIVENDVLACGLLASGDGDDIVPGVACVVDCLRSENMLFAPMRGVAIEESGCGLRQ